MGSKLRHGELTDEHVVLAVAKPRTLNHPFKPLFGELPSDAAVRSLVPADRPIAGRGARNH